MWCVINHDIYNILIHKKVLTGMPLHLTCFLKKRKKIASICLALSTLTGFTEGNWIINLVVRCSTICYILAEDFHKWPCRIMLSSDVLSRACLVQCTDANSSTGSLYGPESVHDRSKVRNSFRSIIIIYICPDVSIIVYQKATIKVVVT